MAKTDKHSRPYARLDNLKVGDRVEVDDGFDCLLPWSILDVVEINGELAVIHNTEDCGACGGENAKSACPHFLCGQDDGDGFLIGIYHHLI